MLDQLHRLALRLYPVRRAVAVASVCWVVPADCGLELIWTPRNGPGAGSRASIRQ